MVATVCSTTDVAGDGISVGTLGKWQMKIDDNRWTILFLRDDDVGYLYVLDRICDVWCVAF